MKKVYLLILALISFSSCADQNKRMKYLQKAFPKCRIEPATPLIEKDGYDFIIIDSTMHIMAVDFYAFSESKIWRLRNIR